MPARNLRRDPFTRYQAIVSTEGAPAKRSHLQFRCASKPIALRKRPRPRSLAAPKPTTALMLSEVQVTGIFRTPRGWSAMVEATPLSPNFYVIYPGENFFDGQLVAIEEGRLVFRRDILGLTASAKDG